MLKPSDSWKSANDDCQTPSVVYIGYFWWEWLTTVCRHNPVISLQDFAACSSAQLTPSRAVLGPLTSTGNESGCARTECYQNQREKLRRQKQLTQYLPTQRKVTLHGVGWFPDAVIPAASDSTAANSATVAQVDVCNVPISCDINATSGAIYHQQYRAMRKRQGAPAHRHA
jgi:hypothetical protein